MKEYLIVSKKKWNINNFQKLPKNITFSNKINLSILNKKKPKIIFFIHWSKFIPSKIYKKFLCIQFHSSDLPKYRGGSPIQNQIIRGVKKTKISAFKISDKIDSGPICLQRKINLSGSAQQIYENLEKKCLLMIFYLINKKKILFKKQKGGSSYFKRRKPEQSNLNKQKGLNISKILDFINMLDAKDYPKAYIDLKNFRISLSKAKVYNKKEIQGEFRINKK